MARIEKTVFISYRRADVYTALAVYENLKNQGYDVFFDYRSISSGDFEQIITSNIKARAHFLLILTPTALDRCNEPGDWLRREIEIAIDEKRNIIPLFFKGFRFGTPSVSEKLTGKLSHLSRYNGLNVHEDYFDEAMHRLPMQYLNKPLDTILHPVSTDVRKVVREEQLAADKALAQIEDIKELVKQTDENPPYKEDLPGTLSSRTLKNGTSINLLPKPWRVMAVVGGGVLIIGFLIWGAAKFMQNLSQATSEPTGIFQPSVTSAIQPSTTMTPEQTDTPSSTETFIPVTPTLGIGSMMSSAKDGMTILYVPAGEFEMGDKAEDALADCQKSLLKCELDWFKDEAPPHTVELDTFWIDQTEVTNKMYALCVTAGVCKEPTSKESRNRSSYYNNSNFDNYPVIYVDWNMAKTYCTWADRRLPTEAEWEKAARGPDGRIYPWGNDAPNYSLLNYLMAVSADTTEVGTYSDGIGFYGVLDMAGNVSEWVNDWYSEDYYLSSLPLNPLGPDSGQYRVLRGTPEYYIDNVRSAARDRNVPSYSSDYVGFRCAMDATP